MKQTILSFILALLPIMAIADDNGTCGKNLTWSYVESTKTLTISGTGDMTHYSDSYSYYSYITTAPWNSYVRSIQNVIIESGVTSIGGYAFYGCSGLTSIMIPNSVTSIGASAFYGTGWYNNQPDGLVYAGKVAYKYKGTMPNNTSITIKEGTLGITDYAFYECSGLTSVSISNDVTSIGNYAFAYCGGLTSVTIPNNVTSIGNYAFAYCGGLTSVTIPNNVTSIGNYAFYNCNGLTSVTIPNSVTSISEGVFSSCSGLISVTIPNSVTSISEGAFTSCSGLTSITIPNSVTSLGKSAFSSCSGLTSVAIPNSVTSIGVYAFRYCSGLTSVIIGSGVTTIGSDAFSGTNLKKTIWLTNTPPSGYNNASGAVNYVSNDQFSSLSNVIKYQFLSSYFDVDGIRYVPVSPSERICDAIDCVYNESVKDTKIASTVVYKGITMTVENIQPYLAYNNKYIENLTVDSEGNLAKYAFANCSNMKFATLGQKITTIGEYAFSGCKLLQAFVIPSLVTTINTYTFQNCSSLPAITIHKTINSINNYAFTGCSGLKKVIIADRETELTLGSNGSSPLFASCPLDSVYIGGDISYKTSSNYGYSPFYRNTSLRAVNITDKETEISDNEFYGCTNLQRVIIGDGVTSIGNWAFSGSSSLKFFAFGSQVATIGQEAFSDCSAVTEIISKAATPPVCGSQALDDINKWECKLFVPTGTQAAYSGADQWKDFFFSEEGTGTATQNPEGQPETGKCETPTITIKDGVIHFACATEGVSYTYNVSATNPSGVGNDISPSSMTITVYASKPGFETSEAATMEIAAGGGKLGDLTGDGKVDVADHVKLSSIIMDQK